MSENTGDEKSEMTRDDWESHWSDFADAYQGNPATAYRSRLITEALGHLGPSDRLVDIGCGAGDLVEVLHQAFPQAQLLGIDGAEAALVRAEKVAPGARFQLRDLMREEPVSADLQHWGTHAVCSEVLEHVDQPELLLRNSVDYLAPGCTVVITVPSGPMSSFDHFIGHRRHFTSGILSEVIEKAGLNLISIKRSGFPFFNLYRVTVLMRGDQLVADARRAATSGKASLAARVMLRLFGLLFRANLPSSKWGWQLVATARVPRPTG